MENVGNVTKATIDYFEWKIPDFFAVLENRKSNFVGSPSFTYSSNNWHLKLDVNTSPICPWIWLYICTSNASKNVNYTLGIKKSDSSLYKRISHTISKTETNLEHRYVLIKLCDLQKRRLELLPDGTMTVLCRMKLDKSCPDEESLQPMKLEELEVLSSNVNELLVSKKKCDVTIKLKDKEFPVHKAVLMARSSVFAAMFERGLSVEKLSSVIMPDCDPDSFRDFLLYLYTGKMENVSFTNVCQLYVTADKYNVQELKSFCVKYMEQNLTAESVCDVVTLVDQYDEITLLSSVQKYFSENMNDIMLADEWGKMMKNNNRLANMLLKDMVTSFKITLN